MKTCLTNFAAAIAAIVLASSADALTLSTAPAAVAYPAFDGTLNCNILNVSASKTLNVQIFALDYSGSMVFTPGNQSLAPGQVASFPEATAAAYCRFTVAGGGRKDVRAAAVYQNGTQYTIAIPAK